MYDYLIVGAGLFGAVFAYEASQKGKRCLVIDKRNHIGGNAYCENIEGVTVHMYGAHIFHTNDKFIWDYINRFSEFNRFTNSPIANFNDSLYNLPFNMNTFYKLWGVTTPEAARSIIDSQRKIVPNPLNLEEKAISLVGADLYEKFIKGFAEKQWGKKCVDLPTTAIEKVPVKFTFDNDFFNEKYQGIPVGGYNQIFEKLLTKCDVKLGADFFSDRDRYSHIADKVIFTGMIDEFFDHCYGGLEYRSLLFEFDVLNIPDFQGNAIVNYTSYDVPYTRIVEHKHFEFGTQDKTVITYEYPREWSRGCEPYYPVHDEKNIATYNDYRAIAKKEKNVVLGGRLGRYRCLSMCQVIAEALECARVNL